MTTYFSTFITGTGPIIEKAIKSRPIDKIKIENILDGLITYYSTYPEREIRNIRFFNNSFTLLGTFSASGKGAPAIEKTVKQIISSKKEIRRIKKFLKQGVTFKVVTSVENETVSIDRNLLMQLEKEIQKECSIRLKIKSPEKELWLIARSEGTVFFGLRITYPRRGDRKLEKGELRPELANIMSIVSSPSPKDIVLDMFAGHGSIPIERAVSYPYKKIIAVEKNQELVKEIKNRAGKDDKEIDVIESDAFSLSEVPDESVDKIITDPPWGIYEKIDIPLNKLYEKIIEVTRVKLKPGGTAVILTAAKEELENAVGSEKTIHLKNKYDTLVSGKKASIYVLKKQEV